MGVNWIWLKYPSLKNVLFGNNVNGDWLLRTQLQLTLYKPQGNPLTVVLLNDLASL